MRSAILLTSLLAINADAILHRFSKPPPPHAVCFRPRRRQTPRRRSSRHAQKADGFIDYMRADTMIAHAIISYIKRLGLRIGSL